VVVGVFKSAVTAVAAAMLLTCGVRAQTSDGPGASTPGAGCECGKHPPGQTPDRTVAPYAGEPEDLQPYAKFSQPYDVNYTQPNRYFGAGRDIPDPTDLTEVRIGFIGPIAKQADQVFGLRMLHGAQLAIDEANARGGYGGKPFRLMVHDDYNNWQRGSEYGPERPTDAAIWGSPSDEAVKMAYEEKDWAIFGGINSETTHIILRVALRAEIPIVNSASTDPTIPETYIPWYFTDIQDDRVQDLTLARHIFTELGLKRVALLRVNNRYGRFGVPKFRDAARRLGHPVVIEQKFMPGDTDFRRALRIIQDSRADGIVVWADEAQAAGILQQMRELGMKQRVFGSYRTLGDELLKEAGPAAEGFEAVFPYDPSRTDSKWTGFEQRYADKFNEKPEQFAALAYDAMNALLGSICRAGLNRARIHDALSQIYEYDGVTGHMVFDPNNKNVSPMFLGTVKDGKITYRVARMSASDQRSAISDQQKPVTPSPYARVGEDGVSYLGPHTTDLPSGLATIVLFGPRASEVIKTLNYPTLSAPKSGREQNGAPGDPPGLRLVAVDSGQNWGVASTQLVHALMEEHALAVIALDRDCAHLAEQLALKIFVPVVALSDDKALTSTNVAWIFRLPPNAGAAEAVQLVTEAARVSGENPEKLRDVLASGTMVAGVRFLSTGEPAQ
jgi:ABC-type branched-subunit amino acid transport system substrate-binding protein